MFVQPPTIIPVGGTHTCTITSLDASSAPFYSKPTGFTAILENEEVRVLSDLRAAPRPQPRTAPPPTFAAMLPLPSLQTGTTLYGTTAITVNPDYGLTHTLTYTASATDGGIVELGAELAIGGADLSSGYRYVVGVYTYLDGV